MPSIRVSRSENIGYYFLTFTIKDWVYLLDRCDRWRILADSLNFCHKNKGLKVYCYVFMINHIHLIIYSPDVAGFIRDFKKFTSFKIGETVIDSEKGNLELFTDTKTGRFRLWERTNMPKPVHSYEFLLQKVDYIHNNPVSKGYVNDPKDWVWSSANPNSFVELAELEM